MKSKEQHIQRKINLQIFLHIIAWMILFIVPTYFFYLDSAGNSPFINRAIIQTAIYFVIFYLNYLWLAPKLFFNNKKVKYFIYAGALVILMSFFESTFHRQFSPKPPLQQEIFKDFTREHDKKIGKPPRPSKNWPLYNFILTATLISGFGIGVRIAQQMANNEKQRKEMEKERLNFELEYLKHQINPHFFFNTLNNIYALIQTNAGHSQKAIISLSKIMRYFLDDTHKEEVLLSKEVDFMKEYVELMKLRITSKTKLNSSFDIDLPEITVPPFLFIPFIENAFKHGVSNNSESFINIFLKFEESSLRFYCQNSIRLTEKSNTIDKITGGIGLDNVKKRLSLLLPGKYQLSFNQNNDIFEVSLIIKI